MNALSPARELDRGEVTGRKAWRLASPTCTRSGAEAPLLNAGAQRVGPQHPALPISARAG